MAIKAGRGSSGVPAGGQLAEDIAGLSDEAKRKKREAEAKAREAKIKEGLDKALGEKKPRSATAGKTRLAKARYYELQAVKNRRMAKGVKGTSAADVKSRNTHTRVADEYVTKAKALRKEFKTKGA